MTGVKLDRGHRGKVNAVVGTPGSTTKGNIAQNDSGWIYTRTAPGEDWNLSSPFQNNGSAIYPIATGTSHSLKDYSQTLNVLRWEDDRCYFGAESICYVSDGTALKEMLENSYSGIIILYDGEYLMPLGKITISYPKTIIGASRSKSIIVLGDNDTNDYIAISNTNNVVFRNLTITRDQLKSGTSPDALVYLDKSTYCSFLDCNIGDANLIMSSGSDALIKTATLCDYLRIDNCKFVLDNDVSPVHPALILVTGSDAVTITNNYGANLHCNGSVVADDCAGINISNNLFTNKSTKDTCVGISLTGSSAASYICGNRISNVNDYGALTSANLLFVDDTIGGVVGYISNITATNNQLFFTVETGHEDDAPEDALITLGIRGGVFTGNKIVAEYHGYEDDVSVDVVPSKVVVLAYGESIVISNNTIKASNCRCAVMVDSYGPGSAPGKGHRIIGNDIYDFSIDTPGVIAGTGVRNDASGIYLSDNELGTPPHGIVISGNTLDGGDDSTAIRGCPLNCYPPSWPPSAGDTAERCAITGNIVNTSRTDNMYGISVATISYSAIVGNVHIGDYNVIDTTDIAGYTNDTNEYGTAGDAEQGVNL